MINKVFTQTDYKVHKIMEGKTRNNVGHNANISNLQNY